VDKIAIDIVVSEVEGVYRVDGTLMGLVPGVGWVVVHKMPTALLEDFQAELAAELTSEFPQNDPIP